MEKLKKKIKHSDIFGHQITLNFDSKEKTKKSLPGRILTLLYYIIFISYVVYCCYKRAYNLQDIDNLVTTTQDLNALG
jgi:hypothetical protein